MFLRSWLTAAYYRIVMLGNCMPVAGLADMGHQIHSSKTKAYVLSNNVRL